MRGLASRARAMKKKKKKRALLLPPDDGLIPVQISTRTRKGVVRRIELLPPEEVKAECERKMALHDGRWAVERWGGNQWGEQWVCEAWTRELYQTQQPLLLTDLPFAVWCAACGLGRS